VFRAKIFPKVAREMSTDWGIAPYFLVA